MDTPDRFVADLALATIGTTVNPYSCHDPALDRSGGAAIRRENLRRYLSDHLNPALLLVGEAPSYRGCRFSGIAFTSERTLPVSSWSSTHPRGWTEPSATIVHRVLRGLDIEDRTMLWNAVPTHPAADTPLSNRPPTGPELTAGLVWLGRLIELVEPEVVVAVGRSAESVLPGRQSIRHPANGGSRLFADQLAAMVAGGLVGRSA
jgi:uracil-DNA glycosylase